MSSLSRRILVPILAILLAAVALPVLGAPASANTLSGQGAGYSPGWKILWGSDAELAKDLDGMVATGAKWIRIDFDWPSIQPDQSSWYWHATDRAVREATKRGLQVLALPTYTPAWQRPANTTDKHAPRDPAAYAAFVKAAAERYAPQGVKHWEIWNEANIVNFWQPAPDPVAYTALLKAAATAIRSVDASATIITSGTAPAADTTDGKYVHPTTFLKTIYQQGGKGSFDAVAHHPYSFPVNPLYQHRDNAFWGVTPALRDIMVANGDGTKKIWGTEFGAPTGTNSRAVSETTQADHLVEAYTAWSSWSFTGPLLWYNWRNTGYDTNDVEQNFGLVTDDFKAKPALAAMTKLFAGTSSTTSPALPTTTAPAPTTTTTAPTTTTTAPTTTTTAPVVAPTKKLGPGRIKRISGTTRFATAAAVATDSAAASGEGGTVFVASGASYADALAGGAPAALQDAPILLTEQSSVPEHTRAELQRLGPDRVFIMGGTSAISPAVEQELRSLTSADVRRLDGNDRFATAVRATQRFFPAGVDQLYIADGMTFADALAGGALAGRLGAPLLLVNRNGISDVVRAEILRLRPRSIVIAGGESAVPETVRLALVALTGAPVTRVFGGDRYATAAALTDSVTRQVSDIATASTAGALPDETVYVASGRGFADALAAAPAAARSNAPVLLVEQGRLPEATRAALVRLAPQSIVIVGGPAAISQQVEDELRLVAG